MRARAGVTLVELLLVLVILGVVATLVVPGTASVFRGGLSGGNDTATALASARRLAVQHGVTVRLQVDADGRWRVRIPGASDSLAAGQQPAEADRGTDLFIDPLGTCRPAPGWRASAADEGAAFDAGRCRWVPVHRAAGAIAP
jgi:prepilin-type N-terminal cleavage/methylation domain-containing protein